MAEDRYFPGEEEELRQKLDAYLEALARRVGEAAFAGEVAFLLLGGGYGRGEGGVLRTAETVSLYNDLEFYCVLKTGAAADAARRWCAEEAHRGERETGIEVEFKVLTLAALQGPEPSMFYYDLLAAHRFVFGDSALVAALPERLRDAGQIPAHEATRLLFNRGTGLFFCRFSMERQGAGPDKRFVERNHAKLRLALADAVLALNGRYHFSCIVRGGRLAEQIPETPPGWDRLVAWHKEAVAFKFHPRHEDPPLEELGRRQEELMEAWSALFLWLESIRLRHPFRCAPDYAFYQGRLFPEFPVPRNWLLHLRDRLRRGKPPRGWMDYPRAALQRALVLLLQPEGGDPRNVLALPAGASMEEIHATYSRWWRFYN